MPLPTVLRTRVASLRQYATLSTPTSHGNYGSPALWTVVAVCGLLASASAKTTKALTLRVFRPTDEGAREVNVTVDLAPLKHIGRLRD